MHAEAELQRHCPFHAPASGAAGLRADEVLVLPNPRRAVLQYFDRPAGGRELRLFLDDKEISFDDPAFFAFGEGLVREPRFAAGDTMRWGEGYAWAQVAPLLAELIDEGVLQRAAGLPGAGEATPPRPAGERPSPLPPAPASRPRSWADSETLMAELTGRPLEIGWLEVVVPVFRVAHMALDAEGRQVGEANVFPPALRLDVPTRWRTCIYPGTRYQVDRPMNVTALKAMRQHWPAMMQLLGPVRAAYLRRFPPARQGWTVGHLERLATAVLGLATYPLVRARQPVANGALHPALSSLFRVTDGLRMTMHQMLFVPIGEPTLSPQAPMSAAAVLDYAERNYSFHSEHGVCAGPRAMVEEFLAVLIDGAAPPSPTVPDPALHDALADLEPAVDYALRGLKVYAATFSLWPMMTRAFEALAASADRWAGQGGEAPRALALRLRQRVQAQRQGTYLAHESWRVDRERVYADMHAQCAAGLGESPAPLAALIAARREAGPAALADRLCGLLRPRLGDGGEAFAHEVAGFLLDEQALLRVAASEQAQIARLLGRPAPRRALDARDLDLHNQLQGGTPRRVPDLVAELAEALDLRIEIDTERLVLEPRPTGAAP